MRIYIQNFNLILPERGNENIEQESVYALFTKQNAPDGVYICTESDNLCLPKYWGLCKEKAKSIAFIKGDMKRMISLYGYDAGIKLLEPVTETKLVEHGSLDDALNDHTSFENTKILLDAGSEAAEFCKKIGCKWYLPTLNEMTEFFGYKKEIDAALTIAGGEPFFYGWHWTSTRHSSNCYWVFYWDNGFRSSLNQYYFNRVRPVSAF